MFRLYSLLICFLLAAPVGYAQAAPQDSPGTIYIDGVPCNRACQSYMAWSRQVLSQQAAAAAPERAARIARPSKAQSQRTAKMPASAPAKVVPTRVATKSAPRIEPAPPKAAAPILGREETNVAPSDKPATSAATNTTGNEPDQATTRPVEDTSTAAITPPKPEQEATTDTAPADSSPNNAQPGADTTAAVMPNESADEKVAIILVRPGIGSVADLSNKIVAVDESPTDYSVAEVKSAMVAAGAAKVQLVENQKMALIRIIDGEVQAAVVSVMPTKAAEAWNAGLSGFKVLRIPLVTPLEKAKRG